MLPQPKNNKTSETHPKIYFLQVNNVECNENIFVPSIVKTFETFETNKIEKSHNESE